MAKKTPQQAYNQEEWLNPDDFFSAHQQPKESTPHSDTTLYLIPLPLDLTSVDHIPAVVCSILPTLDLFFVENVRTARRFISSLKLNIKISDLTFHVFDKNTDKATALRYIDLLKKSKKAGLMSECGLPGIADPGAALVSLAHQQSITVKPLTGPSSIFLALMSSGLNGQQFRFWGYLPIKPLDRKKKILELVKNCQQTKDTQIFIETPYRNDHLIKALLDHLPQHFKLCIGQGITGPQEFIQTDSIQNWKKQPPTLGKMPTVFLFNLF